MPKFLKIALILIAAHAVPVCLSSAFAHEGHGLAGSHWHATDGVGFVGFFVVVALAIWLGRNKK